MKVPFPSFAIVLFIFCSCNSVFYNMAGLKKSKNFNIEKLPEYCNKYQIDYESCYTLNIIDYKKKLEILKNQNPELSNLLAQPIQIRVFNKEGKSTGFLANCQVGGFPNLKWDRFNSFQSYPPDFSKFKSLDTVFTFTEELKLINKIEKPLDLTENITFIVYWSYLMGRQSKRLIHILNNYKEVNSKENIRFYFVNVDSLYL